MEPTTCFQGCLANYARIATLCAGAVATWGAAVFLRPVGRRSLEPPFTALDFALACSQWAIAAIFLLMAIALGLLIFKICRLPPQAKFFFYFAVGVGWLLACYVGFLCNSALVTILWPDSKIQDLTPLAFFAVEWIVVAALMADVLSVAFSNLSDVDEEDELSQESSNEEA